MVVVVLGDMRSSSSRGMLCVGTAGLGGVAGRLGLLGRLGDSAVACTEGAAVSAWRGGAGRVRERGDRRPAV